MLPSTRCRRIAFVLINHTRFLGMVINHDYYQMCITLGSKFEPDLKISFPFRAPSDSEGS